MQFRTDLAIEAREIAGENTGGIEFKKYSENGLEISRLIVKNQKARQALGKEIGTYITIELTATTLHSSIALILAKTAVHLIRCFLKQRATVRIMRFTTFP